MGISPLKICMLADGHGLYDDRIYWKEGLSLMKAGYEVHYILAGDQKQHGTTKEGVRFIMLKRDRFSGSPVLNFLAKHGYGGLYDKMFQAAKEVGAAVYHIHDLKVNRIGNRLKNLPQKPKLIYDVHEPFPENILDYWKGRRYLSAIRRIWAGFIRHWEKRAVRKYDLIITTEENMADRFRNYYPDKPVLIIYNYTNLTNTGYLTEQEQNRYDAIYTGGITVYRGAWQILKAVKILKQERPDISVLFIGTWFPLRLRKEMEDYIRIQDMQSNVIMKNAVPYSKIAEYYGQSRIGLGIFLPILTHKIILQIKIFEYLNFGLPMVGSNFGHINEIIQRHDCGLSVDPENPGSIAQAMLTLLKNKDIYSRMSTNARLAAQNNYQWEAMESKLNAGYFNLTGPDHEH